METTIIFLIVFAATMVIFGITYFFIKRHEHKLTRDRRIAACEQLALCKVHKELFIDLANRTFVFYYSFALQNIVGILCDLFSFVFSVTTFVQVANQEANITVSLLAIIFVIIAIYIKPRRRSSQYLYAWRQMEYMTQDTLQKLMLFVDPQLAGREKVDELFGKVNERRAAIEAAISTDAE